MKLSYTSEFAKTIWLPFGGLIGALIINSSSTKEDFLKCKENWFSERGLKYSGKELAVFWSIIETQKERMEKFYRGVPLNSKLKN